MRIAGWWICSAKSGAPKDLPPWAENELVRRRMKELEYRRQLTDLRLALAVARGEDPTRALLRELES